MWTDLAAALINAVVGYIINLLATGVIDFISALFGIA